MRTVDDGVSRASVSPTEPETWKSQMMETCMRWPNLWVSDQKSSVGGNLSLRCKWKLLGGTVKIYFHRHFPHDPRIHLPRGGPSGHPDPSPPRGASLLTSSISPEESPSQGLGCLSPQEGLQQPPDSSQPGRTLDALTHPAQEGPSRLPRPGPDVPHSLLRTQSSHAQKEPRADFCSSGGARPLLPFVPKNNIWI